VSSASETLVHHFWDGYMISMNKSFRPRTGGSTTFCHRRMHAIRTKNTTGAGFATYFFFPEVHTRPVQCWYDNAWKKNPIE